VITPDTKLVRLGGRPPQVTLVLLLVQGGLFLIYAFADGPKWVAEHLAVNPPAMFGRLELWQPLTAVWLHLGTRNLLLDLLALWVFGSALERWWGGRRLLLFFVATGAVGLACAGLGAQLLGGAWILAGSSGAAMAMIVACALLFRRHLVHLVNLMPLKCGVFALLVGVFTLVGTLVARAWPDLVVQLTGAAFALPFLFPPRQTLARWQVEQAKKRFKVVEGGREDSDERYLN